MALSWTVEVLNAAVEKELDALPADMRARFAHIGELIAEFGLNRVGMPHVRHLTGPLWEMRLGGRDGIARALYVAATRRTPRREIELALRRAEEVLQ